MSKRRLLTAKRRRLPWVVPALLLCAVWYTTGESVRAQQSTEFVLRAPAALIQQIAARHGLTVIRQLVGQDVFLVTKSATIFRGFFDPMGGGGSSDGTLAVVTEVQSDPEVVHFEENAVVVTPEVASAVNLNGSAVSILDALSDRSLVPFFDAQAWIHYVNQPATAAIKLPASRQTGTGAGIVAIIDTGVDPDHPLLAGSLVAGYDFVHDIAGQASEWTDLDGSAVSILDGSAVSILDSTSVVSLNGSAVAILDQATATALNPGLLPRAFGHGTMVAGLVHLVAPTAQIMPLKAFKADGTSTVFDVVRAIYYAVDHGARVINMSFSATASSPEIVHAINVATSSGVICVASAGNLGEEVVVYPGALRNVVGVGSTSSDNPPTRSPFSNYGDALVSLGAPGEAVITTYPGAHYAGVWGTSFSTPLAAGGVALLLQVDPNLDQAKAAELLGRADRMPSGTGMGRGRLNLYEAVRSLPDATPPVVSFVSPGSGVLFESVLVSASASDNVGVAGVRFLLDDNPIGPEVIAAPYELTWTTTTASNGTHMLRAIARDAEGNQAASIVNVTVSNDTMGPTVTLISPAAGATASGMVMVSATASDDLAVAGVHFTLDGAPLGTEDVIEPYELAWSTESVANGPHTLTVVARDAAGHETTASAEVTVANDAAAPTLALTNPTAAATVSGTVTLAAVATDDVGVAGVQFQVDGVTLGAEVATAPYEVAWPTASVANGAHSVTVVARDSVGHETATSVSVTVSNDATAPTVALSSPAAEAVVSGAVLVSAIASDDLAVSGVQFQMDGVTLGAEVATAPYEVAWPTESVANGAHTVTAVARDAAGHQTATSVSVTVSNDAAPPTVALSSPAAEAAVSGTVMVSALASDDLAVAGVQFQVDGVTLGAEVVTAPYEVAWPTGSVANGAHTVTAVARDAAGHQTATNVSVTVSNDAAPPTVALSSPAAEAAVSGTVMVSALASDDLAVAGVQFQVDGVTLGAEVATAPYEVAWPTGSVANGAHTVTAVARDAAGHETATSVSVTVSNDAAPPTVALSSPAAEAAVSGTVMVSALASDDLAVAGVRFQVDGVTLGAEVATAPYEVAWPTGSVANGAHTVTAVARDAAGHETATSVSVTVSNDAAPPTVALSSPAAEAAVSGTVMVSALASDDLAVAGVQFQVDGVTLGAEVATAPYEVAWPTGSVANGAHTVTAVARDAAGHQTATNVSVTVSNDAAPPTVALSSPAAEAAVSGTVMVSALASDDLAVAGVQFQVDGVTLGAEVATAPYEVAWPTGSVANGAHTVTAVARDAAGHQTATNVSVTVSNDAAPPTVALSSPAAEAAVSGTVMVSALASDDLAVAGVQFQVDGVTLDGEVMAAPYEVAWPTGSVANGTHTVTAVARDAAGHETATSVSVTVSNEAE